MTNNALWSAAALYLGGAPAQYAFAARTEPADGPCPALAELTAAASLPDAAAARRLVNLTYALAATLPVDCRLALPPLEGTPLRTLYPTRSALEPLLAVLDQLTALRESCDALPDGAFALVKAEGDLLHFTRTGPTEILDAVFNRGGHLLAAAIDGKTVEVNPCGFTLTVREHGHNADHSYFDFA